MATPEQMHEFMQQMFAGLAQQQQQFQQMMTQTLQSLGAQQGSVPGRSDASRHSRKIEDVDDKYFKKIKTFKGENWKDWAFHFKAAVRASNMIAFDLLVWSEKETNDIDTFVDFDDCTAKQAEDISAGIFNQLVQVVDIGSESMDILQNSNCCGLAAWRKLIKRFAPTTPLRGMHLMMQVVTPKKALQPKDVAKSVEKWETTLLTLEKDFGEKLSEKFKTAILLTMMPKDLQDTLVQHTDKFDNYRVARDKVLTVAESKTLLKDPDAMDIGSADREWREWHGYDEENEDEGADELNYVGKGSATHCWRCGGIGHISTKCATPKPAKGAPKGGGKGGKSGHGKGKGGKGGTDWNGFCSYCGKRGHGPKDCWAKQKDDGGKSGSNMNEDSRMGIGSAENEGSSAAVGRDACQVEHEISGFDIGAVDVDREGGWQQVTRRSRRRGGEVGSAGAASPSTPTTAACSAMSMEINAVEKTLGLGRITIDSGAAESVLPDSMLPEIPLRESAGSRAGLHYIAANGSRMPNMGEKRVPFRAANGAMSSVLFQVTNARKPLASVSRIVAKGNRVVFGRQGSYIENEGTGRRIPIIAENGTYHMDVEFLAETSVSDFARPA